MGHCTGSAFGAMPCSYCALQELMFDVRRLLREIQMSLENYQVAVDLIGVHLRSSAVAMLCAFALTTTSHAQQYPAKPVKIIVGFAVGGAADVTARMLQPKLNALLGQPVIIDNRLGSGGAIAT